jgi:hypothetical protein
VTTHEALEALAQRYDRQGWKYLDCATVLDDIRAILQSEEPSPPTQEWAEWKEAILKERVNLYKRVR